VSGNVRKVTSDFQNVPLPFAMVHTNKQTDPAAQFHCSRQVAPQPEMDKPLRHAAAGQGYQKMLHKCAPVPGASVLLQDLRGIYL
jgi:hypothetical protein